MRLLNCLKAVVLAVLVGCTLWSCSSDEKGKARYVPVILDGEEKWSILDTKTGDILCRNDFDDEPSFVEDGVFVVRSADGFYQCYKVDDSKNPISKGKFTQLGTFGRDGVTFAVKQGKGIIIVDKDFNEVKKLPKNVTQTTSYAEGLAAFYKNGKWGFLDTKGEVAIPAKFDQVMPFDGGRTLALNGDKILIINKKGETVKSFSADRYSPLQYGFHNGYIAMRKGDDKVVFLDKNGEEKFSSNKMEVFACYQIDDDKTVFYKDGKFGIITTDGEVLVRPKYSALQYASKDRYLAREDNGKCGIINSKGEKILDFEYSNLAQVSSDRDRYFALDGTTWILINEKGEELTKDSYTAININDYAVRTFYSEDIADETEPLSLDYDSTVYIDDDYYAADSLAYAY